MTKLILFFIDIIRNYYHQPNILKYLKKLKLNTVFDIGAHNGETIEYLLKIQCIKKIYSFEPQKKIFVNIKKKYIKSKRVFIKNIAFSDKENKQIFYINKLSLTSTFSKINTDSLWFKIKKKNIKN